MVSIQILSYCRAHQFNLGFFNESVQYIAFKLTKVIIIIGSFFFLDLQQR